MMKDNANDRVTYPGKFDLGSPRLLSNDCRLHVTTDHHYVKHEAQMRPRPSFGDVGLKSKATSDFHIHPPTIKLMSGLLLRVSVVPFNHDNATLSQTLMTENRCDLKGSKELCDQSVLL